MTAWQERAAAADRPAVRKGELHGVAGGAVGAHAAAQEAGPEAPERAELGMVSPELALLPVRHRIFQCGVGPWG
jgi:hypothetical protein